MSDKFPLGCLFFTAASLIAIFYFIGILEQQKEMEAFSSGIRNLLYAVTGRNEQEMTIEDETPVYYPQIPKETERKWQV